MGSLLAAVVFLFHFLVASSALPLCTDLRAPVRLNSSLAFCPYNGTVCCNPKEDLGLQKQFRNMNISDPACAALVKSILCATCDPFSAELFQAESQPRTVPLLCNSSDDYCSRVWNTCQNISIRSSPFAPSLQGSAGGLVNSSSASKLTDLWQSSKDFCAAFAREAVNGSVCFEGKPVAIDNNTQTPAAPSGLCLEKIGNGSYLDMAAHPDGTNRVFLSDQPGHIWLATVPDVGSGGTLTLTESDPFLDLTDEVHFDTEFGLMAIAFHPDFARNGRFFASFNCDKASSMSCSGRCSCNSDVGCDPSKLVADSGAEPCRYHSIVAEFTVNGTASTPSSASSANPTEVRRIFTMGLPFTGHHAGQILFGPDDGYLYFMMGDGGNRGDPYNFSQNKKSLLGKIMRLDVDNIPSAKQVTDLGLWGNYSIPRDNPYVEDKDLKPEIWSLGLRNPWRCSFDSVTPSYFFCADVGQEVYEEVNLISKGGNYGWRVYEGPSPYKTLQSPGGNTSSGSISPIFSIMGYTHSSLNTKEGSASITGGYMYRGSADPCMSGRYLYADLYGGAIWAGAETPENSGNFTSSRIPFRCAENSPISCGSTPGSPLPSLGYIFSFGQDNKKDVYILASTGVYRVVRPSRCNYTCSKETNASDGAQPSGGSATPSSATCLNDWRTKWTVFLPFLLLGFNLINLHSVS
ncbi:HIPL1 protein [Aristolochia californica]|uniref:HIPL1 protein n=1 Tax=Aristolochia californica TaxID=171875 RepID=UPI0035DD454B